MMDSRRAAVGGWGRWAERPRLAVAASARPSALVAVLLVVHAFLPYVPGSRLRADVAMGYLCALLLPWLTLKWSRVERIVMTVGVLSSAWCFIRLFPGEAKWMDKIIHFTNYSFIPLSLATFMVWRRFLSRIEDGVVALLVISLPINGEALFQWADPTNAFHLQIFSLFGGANLTDTDVGSYAEYMLVYAGRCTGIFNGMHALGTFNVIIIIFALSYAAKVSGSLRKSVLPAVAGTFAVLGGVVAASKSFYFGVAIGVGVLLVLRRMSLTNALLIGTVTGAFGIPQLIAGSANDTTEAYVEVAGHPTFENTLDTRYGSDGFLTPTVNALTENVGSMLFGVGSNFGQLVMADSAYLSTAVIGGLVLLILFFGTVLALVRALWADYVQGSLWAGSCLAMHVALLAIGVGIPTYQLGRLTPLAAIMTFWALHDWLPEAAKLKASEVTVTLSGGETADQPLSS
jgi:hypothetical protein